MIKNPQPSENNTFCYYPFFALALKVFDDNKLTKVAPCCKMLDMNHSVLSKFEIGNLSPDEIFNHEKFNTLRKDALTNIKNPNCEVCWRQEDRGYKSFRLISSWTFNDEFKKDLRELDLSFSNKCNLACRMCNLGSTHQLYKDKIYFEENKLMGRINEATSSAPFPSINVKTEDNTQLEWVLNNYENIKILKMSGGEPLYDKRSIELLKRMVDSQVSKKCRIMLHTNATLLDEEKIDLLNNFMRQSNVFSVDGVGKTYDYIRHNSSFELIDENIFRWLRKSKNIKMLSFNLVLSALNVLELSDYFEWISNSFSYKYHIRIDISEIRPYTRGTSLYNLPIELLEESKQKIKNFFENNKNELLIYEKHNVYNMIDLAIKNNTFDKNKQYLKDEITLFDQSRNQSYKDFLNPSLVHLIDNI